MKLYCIDLSRLNKIELGEIQKRFKVPIDTEELYRLKMSGYNTIYIDEETNKMAFYTLNNAKKTIQVADYLKNIMIDLKPLGYGAKVVVNEHIVKKPKAMNDKEIYEEIDRISSIINRFGYASLSPEEKQFYKDHEDYI